MARFRKRPVEIEAVQYLGDSNFNQIRQFVGSDLPLHRLGDSKLGIQTLEGVIEASPDDWIIRGIQGEFYPRKPGIFDKTYEAVE